MTKEKKSIKKAIVFRDIWFIYFIPFPPFLKEKEILLQDGSKKNQAKRKWR